MKRQSLVLLAVTFVAAGAAGCFSDPVSGLRSGPKILNVDHSAVFVRAGDSTAVTATILDNGGNVLPETDATWSSDNPAVAVVRKDTTVIPGNYLTRAFVRGIDSVSGGWTQVIVATRGVADTIRVTVLPAKLHGSLVSTAGASLTDSVLVPSTPGPPPVAATAVSYTARDTLVLTGTSIISFDTSKVSVSISTTNGTAQGFVVSKTPSVVKAVFQTGAAGKVMVQHLLSTPGNAAIGAIALDTLIGDSVAVAPWRLTPAFGASVTQAGDTLTVSAGTGMTFDTSATVVTFTNPSDSVGFNDTAYVITKSASAYTLLAPTTRAAFRVTVRNVTLAAAASVGSITFDSLKTNDGPRSITRASLPAGVVSQAGDTLTLTAIAPMAFDTGTRVKFGSNNGVIIGRSASQFTYVLSPTTYTGAVTLTGPFVGLTRIPSLTNATSYTLNAFALPAANVSLGGGKLGDTVTITAPAGLPFSTTGTVSNVILGNTAIATSDTAWILSRSASTIKAFAKRGGSGRVTVTNLQLGSLIAPTLGTVSTMAIDSVNSDIAVSQDQATAEALTIPANDTAIVFGTAPPGALNGGFSQSYWTFTTAATHSVKGTVAWFGSGNPYSTGNNTPGFTEDLDMLICDASTVCDESGADLSGFAAATTAQPQTFTVADLPAAQYWINVAGFNVKYAIIYRLTVILQ